MEQHHVPQHGQYPPFSLGDLSPAGSPESMTMPAHGRPATVAVNHYAQYSSLPTQNMGVGEPMGGSQSFAASHGPQHALMQSQQLGSMMMLNQYMHDEGGPWTPLGLQPACGDIAKGQQAIHLSSKMIPNFGGFRAAPPPPSEADTIGQSLAGITSDSGYGSIGMTKHSVGIPSVCGDGDQSIELVSRFQALDSIWRNEELGPLEGRGQISTLGAPAARLYRCLGCNAEVKTKSELKKHEARHNKPFKCTIQDCPKASEGFSTNNDLDRHKRCVHKILTGNEVVYRCDVEQCKDKLKDWPRQDNFKQHLLRKHKLRDVDLSRYMFQYSSSADVSHFGSAGSVPSEDTIVTRLGTAAQTAWTRLGHSISATSGLLHGSPSRPPTGNTAPYQTPPIDLVALGAGALQYSSQLASETTRVPLGMEQALPGLSLARPCRQRASAPTTNSFTPANRPTYSPDLSHVRTEVKSFASPYTRNQAIGVVELDDDAPGPSDDDSQSEQDEVEPSGPDDMDVDDQPHVPDSDCGPEDSIPDAEDVEPSGDTSLPDVGDDEPLDSTDIPHAADDEPSHGPRPLDAKDNAYGTSNVPADAATPLYCRGDEFHIKPPPATDVQTPRPLAFDDELRANALLQSLIDKGKLGDVLKKLGYTGPVSADDTDQKPPVASSVTSDNALSASNKCETCDKTFPRRCELKKHQKRHEKRYACTFVRCHKKFGSKNDWKRHESSQHVQLEIWRCSEKVAADSEVAQQEECGKVCHRLESLKSHLRTGHGIHDPAVLEKKLADCRMGRNFESRFWCGFCQKTIEPTGSGGPTHTERFDHIDDHFNGRGIPRMDIDEWKHVEVDSAENSPVKGGHVWIVVGKPTEKPANPRKRARRDEGEAPAPAAKRAKGEEAFYWSCCSCLSYWRVDSTPVCVDGCNHRQCAACKVFAGESIPGPVASVEAAAQAEGAQGREAMMTL